MRFEIEANCRRGLRIIRNIPDLQLAKIEGYNGLGKSTAIRLLELCAGKQPYQGQAALWATFRDHLIDARVEVTSLNGAQSITWEIPDTSSWPDKPEALGDRIGRIQINGTPATTADVFALLSVHRIDGSESFRDTVAMQASMTASLVASRFGPKGVLEGRHCKLDQALAELEDLLPKASLSQFVVARRATRETAGHLARLLEELRQTNGRVESLAEAVSLSKQLEDVRDRGPDFERAIAELNGQIEDRERRIEQFDEQIEETASREQKDREARRKFDLAKKHLSRCHEQRDRAYHTLVEAAAQARVEASAESIEDARVELLKSLDSLSRRLPEIHSAPRLAELLNRLAELLEQAEADGIAEQILLQAGTATSAWTVRGLREAVEREAAARAAEPMPNTAEQLQTQINDTKERIRLISVVAEAGSLLDHAESRLAIAEERMSTATDSLPADTARTVGDILRSRRILEEELRNFEVRRDHALQAIDVLAGGRSERELLSALTVVCRKAGVSPSRIQGELARAQAAVSDLQASTTAARRKADESTEDLTSLVDAVREAMHAIHERDGLGWLRVAVAQALPGLDAETERQLEFLARLTEAAEKARDRVGVATRDLLGVSGALSDLAEDIRGNSQEPNEWTTAARAWMEAQVNGWLSRPGVRDALFQSATDVGVDLSTMMVGWTSSETGERQRKPLAAFSSGEQAVAYTQARLSLLDEGAGEVANRLIVLDEFGAYVDARRMRNLQVVLRRRSLQFPNDQILLILPLSAEKYQLEADDTPPTPQRRDLEKLGYLVEEIAVEY